MLERNDACVERVSVLRFRFSTWRAGIDGELSFTPHFIS